RLLPPRQADPPGFFTRADGPIRLAPVRFTWLDSSAMALTTQRKILLAVLGLGVAALGVDRTLLGTAHLGPSEAAAGGFTAPQHPPAPRKPTAPRSSPAERTAEA